MVPERRILFYFILFHLKKQEGAESQKLELEAALKNSLEELETKKNDISLLQKQVTDLEQKLRVAGDKSSVKVIPQPKVPNLSCFCAGTNGKPLGIMLKFLPNNIK